MSDEPTCLQVAAQHTRPTHFSTACVQHAGAFADPCADDLYKFGNLMNKYLSRTSAASPVAVGTMPSTSFWWLSGDISASPPQRVACSRSVALETTALNYSRIGPRGDKVGKTPLQRKARDANPLDVTSIRTSECHVRADWRFFVMGEGVYGFLPNHLGRISCHRSPVWLRIHGCLSYGKVCSVCARINLRCACITLHASLPCIYSRLYASVWLFFV